MAAPSTKHKLLSLIEDVEIVSKELFELLATPRQHRPEGIELGQLVELLTLKDEEIQETLKIAKEQAELQKKMDELKHEVDRRDQEIKILQKNLKEAESSLSTAIYQAKQKLGSINQARKKMISSEELIKYAHRISSSNAVAAPPTWVPGDTRRPYPTDIEMRMGFLGRMGDGPPGVMVQPPQPTQPPESLAPGRHPNMEQLLGGQPQTSTGNLQPSGWHAATMDQQHHHGLVVPPQSHSHTTDRPHKDEDVEIMSSDSSSSSSSDE